MAVLPGFIGPSYVSTSPNVAAETLFNWYPQSVEVPTEPARVVYYPRFGKETAWTLPSYPVRCLFEQDGRFFSVGGQTLFELSNNSAALINRGTLSAVDAKPATINSSGTAGAQLFITSGGKGDIFDLNANVLTPITAASYPTDTAMGTYLDSYFLTIKGSSAQFNISGLLDGTAWSGLDFAVRIAGSDNIVGIMQFAKMIWLIGSHTTEPWYDSGNASFPFTAVPQELIQVGCCAPFSIVRSQQALCWLHQSERGRGICMAFANYTPQRISTYIQEAEWATYETISDAVSYCCIVQGHEFMVITFPKGNATWVYDFGERLWHRWSYWNQADGNHDRDRGWVHSPAFGQHYVGDWENGNIYRIAASIPTDDGSMIQWERAAPHIQNQQIYNFYSDFQLDIESGLGNTTGIVGTPSVNLSWSDDGGHVYGNAIAMNAGLTGQYRSRCRAAGNLGRSRDRIFRVRTPYPLPVTNAYVTVQRGTS